MGLFNDFFKLKRAGFGVPYGKFDLYSLEHVCFMVLETDKVGVFGEACRILTSGQVFGHDADLSPRRVRQRVILELLDETLVLQNFEGSFSLSFAGRVKAEFGNHEVLLQFSIRLQLLSKGVHADRSQFRDAKVFGVV